MEKYDSCSFGRIPEAFSRPGEGWSQASEQRGPAPFPTAPPYDRHSAYRKCRFDSYLEQKFCPHKNRLCNSFSSITALIRLICHLVSYASWKIGKRRCLSATVVEFDSALRLIYFCLLQRRKRPLISIAPGAQYSNLKSRRRIA